LAARKKKTAPKKAVNKKKKGGAKKGAASGKKPANGGKGLCTGKACCGTNNIAFGTSAGHEKDAQCHIAAQRYCGSPTKCCNKLSFGIDSNDINLFNYVGPIKAAGAKFVVRYVSHQKTTQFDTPSISAAEAKQWRSVKMPLVAVFEISRTRPIDGGSRKKNFELGITDARAAQKVMDEIGGKNSPVYFAVDSFVDPANFASLRKDIKIRSVNDVVPYFQGVRKVMGASRTGAYGSYTLIKGLFDLNLIKFGWQASSFDSNGRLDPRAQLYQCNVWPPTAFGSNQVDYDFALAANFGQFH